MKPADWVKNREWLGYVSLALLLFAVFPLTLDAFRLNLVAKYLCFALVGIGIVLIWGCAGILSLGQGIFFGLGGYLMAMFLKLEASTPELPDFMVWSSTEVLPWWWEPYHSLTVTVGSILVLPSAVAFALSYAVFRRRVSGVYFAIITLALALALTVLLVGQQGYTGGANGITDFKSLLGWDVVSDEARSRMYFVQAALVFATMLVARFIVRSRLGKILVALRDKEDRVRFSGYDTAMFKAFAFTVGALFASLGGAMYSLNVGLITPTLVGAVASIEMVIYVAVGGRLSIVGAVYGALLVGWAKSLISENFPSMWLFFIGALFIVVTMFLPTGLAGLLDRFRTAMPTGTDTDGAQPSTPEGGK
ncbi:MAG: urea ABC transporter permease subunit UrtC [Burkholderiales bacterium]